VDAHATDAGVSVCPWWHQQLCERAWATDAAVRLTCVRRMRLLARSVNMLSGPRLSQVTDAGSRALGASDAHTVDVSDGPGSKRRLWTRFVVGQQTLGHERRTCLTLGFRLLALSAWGHMA
jgi:hypothetical protein